MSFLTGTNTELIYAATSVGASLNTFTAEALLNTTATMGAQAHLPPDFWLSNQTSVGRGVKIVARGTLATTGAPTYTFTVRGGAAGNTITSIWAGTTALTTNTTVTTTPWEFEVDCILKTLGAAGVNSTLFSVGSFDSSGIVSTANNSVAGGLTTAGTLVTPGTVATLDTSITNYINVNVACGTSNALNIFALQQLLVFGLN